MTTDEDKGKSLLENAYRLATPTDNIVYYKDFSSTYDRDFADDLGFRLPYEVSRVFLARRPSTVGPIADLGCGTGLVGQCLHPLAVDVDGLDISKDMLSVAMSKGVYRRLIELDLTKSVGDLAYTYSAVLSSGTFTHGHLGPDAIDTAIKLGLDGCLFVVSINATHYKTQRFDTKLQTLLTDETIHDLRVEDVAIYSRADHDHSSDRALIVSFLKSEA